MHSNIHSSHSQHYKDDGTNSQPKDNDQIIQTSDHNGIKKKKSKKVACVACHKAHARCDRSSSGSCSRCIKLGIQCIEQIKHKTTREERLRSLQEQRKNSLNMKILPKNMNTSNCNSSTTMAMGGHSTCSVSTTSTSPHSKISPSTPSHLSSSGNPFNIIQSPQSFSAACSQSSTSSTNSESHNSNTSSNHSSSNATVGGYMLCMAPSMNNSQLVSFSHSVPSQTISFQNRSPPSLVKGKCGEINSSGQPNLQFHNPFLQQIMRNSQSSAPIITRPNSLNSFTNTIGTFPTQSSPLGLNFNSHEQHATQQYPQQPFPPVTLHMHHHHHSQTVSHPSPTQLTNQSSSSSSPTVHSINQYEPNDNESTYTSRIFPSSARSAQISEMLDSYSLPNPDDLEQLLSSLENARNV